MSESSREQDNTSHEVRPHSRWMPAPPHSQEACEASDPNAIGKLEPLNGVPKWPAETPTETSTEEPLKREDSEVFFLRTRLESPLISQDNSISLDNRASNLGVPEPNEGVRSTHFDTESPDVFPKALCETRLDTAAPNQDDAAEYRFPRIDEPQSLPEPNRHLRDTHRPLKSPSPKTPTTPSAVSQAVLTMAMLGMALAAARFFVPSIIEEARYAWRRGQLRAEYEVSQSGLRDVGMEKLSSAYKMVTQRVAPSVVHIDVMRRVNPIENSLGFLGSGAPQPATIPGDQGSGVIVDSEGYILTNHHVIADGDEIAVGLSDGRRVRATVVGSDPLTDLALLRVNERGLMAVEWGDSEATEVGIPVWAVGSPFGLDHTITFGILSGKHRAAKAGTSYQDFMQSDVAVNPGNSGGPLVDSLGRLIGINTAIVGDTYQGVSFSVPSNVAKRVYERLRESGRFERGWLGVELAEVPEGSLPSLLPTDYKGTRQGATGQGGTVRGAMIRRLADPRSPAATAGLASGDIIVRFDGQEISDVSSLMRMVGNWPAGQSAVLDVVRDGQEQAFAVQIGARPESLNGR